jgi:uncharacterized protein DUF6907
MTRTMIACPGWCTEDHNLHGVVEPDHFAPRGQVSLSLEAPVLMWPSETWEPQTAAVSLTQPGSCCGEPRVLLGFGDNPEWQLTPAEARQLAAELISAADLAGLPAVP